MARRGRWSRGDLLPAAVVGILVFQLVRTTTAERYRVTSRSMEPILHGDPETGDIVLVDRLAWRTELPRAWDIVVVRSRDAGAENHLVKRLLAIGPAWVEFQGGDAFVGAERGLLARCVKDPVMHRDLRFVHAAYAAGDAAAEFLRADPEVWSVDAKGLDLRSVASLEQLREATTIAAQDARLRATDPVRGLPGHLGLAAEVGPAFVDGTGALSASGGATPRDTGLELELTLAAGVVAVQLVYEYAAAYFSIELDVRSGGGGMRFHGDERARFSGRPIALGVPVTLEFGLLDGRLFLVIDGELVCSEPCELPRESRLVLDGPLPENGLHVAIARGAIAGGGLAGGDGARISRLTVFRDAHYDAENREPYHVEAGQIFVLGDNAYQSSDSRDRFADPFELSDLIGRPCAILGPRGRCRTLPRYPEGP